MGILLDNVAREANKTPVYGVLVGLPGLFVSNTSEMPMEKDAMDSDEAVSKEVKRQFPHSWGFRRIFYKNGACHYIDNGWVYHSGKVRSRDEILSGNDPREDILRSNVRNNGIHAVIVVGDRTYPLERTDKVLRKE